MTLAAMEPMLPSDPALSTRASEIFGAAERLGRHLHPVTLSAVADLLRTVNCYYSNLIEGHDTHPTSIERAMKQDYSANTTARNLQIEALAHITVQKLIEERLEHEPSANVCGADFIGWIHAEFYQLLPEEFRVVRDPESGKEEPVIPGKLRHFQVTVGNHIPAASDQLPALLERFALVYDPSTRPRTEALAALGAAHHRLLWIHPFGDGNGRVTRLMTDAYLRRIGLGGHGLWTASRGLARHRDDYKKLLANADHSRWDDHFFLDICADQIKYMAGLLDIDGLADRALKYGKGREVGFIAGPLTGRNWRPAATLFLRNLVYRGSIPRGEVEAITGMSDRTARRLVNELVAEGFIESDTRRAPLRLRIPAHAAPYLLPDLFNPPTEGLKTRD
ncbi:MAG: Fic family protein [Gemmatimonadota bacterium]